MGSTSENTRLDASGVAAAVGLSVARIEELGRQRGRALRLLQIGSPAERAAAAEYLREDAIPAPIDDRKPRQWAASAIEAWGRRTERIGEDGLPQRKDPPGRPAGGPPAMPLWRRTLRDELRGLDAVDVDPEMWAPLRALLASLYSRCRARGETAAVARESAIRIACETLACSEPAARKVMLLVAAERRRPSRERLAEIDMPDNAEELRTALAVAMYRWGRRGATPAEARAGAVSDVAAETGCAELAAWKVLLDDGDEEAAVA